MYFFFNLRFKEFLPILSQLQHLNTVYVTAEGVKTS